MATYRVETDQGNYDVEVDDGQPSPSLLSKVKGAVSDAYNNPGVQSAIQTSMNTPMGEVAKMDVTMQKGLDRGAEALRNASVGGVQPFKNSLDPMLYATQNAPTVAAAASMAPTVDKVVGDPMASALSKLRGMATSEPSTAETLARLKNAAMNTGPEMTQKTAIMNQSLQDTGASIKALREKLSVPEKLSTNASLGEDLNQAADFMDNIRNTPVEELSKQPTAKLLKIRDAAVAAMQDATPQQKAIMGQGNTRIYDAIEAKGGLQGQIGTEYKTYGEGKKVLEGLPAEAKAQKISFENTSRNFKAKNPMSTALAKLGGAAYNTARTGGAGWALWHLGKSMLGRD